MEHPGTEKLGTVVSEEPPTTSEFLFVIEGNARKGQYVEVPVSAEGANGEAQGRFFGYISELRKHNRYFERPEVVNDYEKGALPYDSWDYSVAQVKLLGFFDSSSFTRAFVPPKPGSDVFLAANEHLKRFLGFGESGLFVGEIEHHKLAVKLSMTRLLQKHLAILAMSGAGKSYLTNVVLEEILKCEKGKIAVVVIDIHGEYAGFSEDPLFGSKTKIVKGNEVRIPLRKIPPEYFEEWFPDMTHVQREVLRDALVSLRSIKKDESYSMKDMFAAIDASDKTKDEKSKSALKRAIMFLKRYRMIGKSENPKLFSDVKPGGMLVFDLSDVDALRKKQIVVAAVARRLFKLRKKEKIPPFLLVIEEAHNFAREKAEAAEAVSKSIIETIAREGRKFGASLCLISQRPVNLSTTALSQCNTHIIMRITNPNDLEHIQMSAEGIDSNVVRSITSLAVGEGIIVGEATNHPVFFKVRKLESDRRKKGKSLFEMAVEFEELKSKREKGAEAFV